MELITCKVKDIHPYARNPRKNDQAVEVVMESIKQCGYCAPIVVDEDNVILAGHTRLKAIKKLGWKECQVCVKDGLTNEQKRKYRLLDNKTNEMAEWDYDLLDSELEGLDFEGFDFGFDYEGTETGTTAEIIEDEAPEPPETPVSKLGDIWQLGRHRLMCGDSTDRETVERLMDGQKADMVFTDPPYGMNAVSKSGVLSKRYGNDIIGDNDNTIAKKAFMMSNRCFENIPQIWWGANYYSDCLPSSECWIVWDKANGASDQTDCELAYSNLRSVVRQFTMASEKQNRVHPTQKPVRLFAEIINKFDKEKSWNNIVDLFGGSGSTLIGCEQMNRTCYMMELDPHYVDVIIQRWENFTGEKAVLLDA